MESGIYNWSDAWLLLAVIYASGERSGATLERIIAIGDGLNHAIFNADEFDSGIARLTDGGFLTEENTIFTITTKVSQVFANIPPKNRTVEKELEALRQMLGAPLATDRQPAINNLKYPGFSDAEYRLAVNKYLSK